MHYRPDDAEDDLCVVVRLICWDLDGTSRIIRDVKEQAVLLVPGRSRQNPRIEAWLKGSADALTTVMKSQVHPSVARGDEEAMSADNALACALPHELVHPEVLKLSRPKTAEDFTRALLDSKRLGGLLFPSSSVLSRSL